MLSGVTSELLTPKCNDKPINTYGSVMVLIVEPLTYTKFNKSEARSLSRFLLKAPLAA